MKNLKLSLLLSLVVIVKAIYAQTSINHHEYFPHSNYPNDYLFSKSSILSESKTNVFICGRTSEYLIDDDVDNGSDAYLIKTDLNGNVVNTPSNTKFNNRYKINNPPYNFSIRFDQVYHKQSQNCVFVAAKTINSDQYGILKIDENSGNVLSQNLLSDIVAQSARGSSFNFIKILDDDASQRIYMIGYASYGFMNNSGFPRSAYKTVILKFDYNLALLDYRAYTINTPISPINPMSEEDLIASDALIHLNKKRNQKEIIITGESFEIQNYVGSTYNHPTPFLLRVDLSTLNPVNLSFYPYLVSTNPPIVESNMGSSICEVGSDKFMIAGFYEKMIAVYGLLLIECGDDGTFISNKSLYLPNSNPMATSTLNRPNSISIEVDNKPNGSLDTLVTLFGDIQISGVYSKLPYFQKYTTDNNSFLLKYNYTNSTVIGYKTLNPISNLSNKNYATNLLAISPTNLVLIGNNLSSKKQTGSAQNGTTYFVNDFSWDMTSCMKTPEEPELTTIDIGQVGIIPEQYFPKYNTLSYNIDVEENEDEVICEESFNNLLETNTYIVQIRDIINPKVIASYEVSLSENNFTDYASWNIPTDILSNLIPANLYICELIDKEGLKKKIFKFYR